MSEKFSSLLSEKHFYSEFTTKWIDSESMPSPQAIKSMGWAVLPVGGLISMQGIESLLHAVSKYSKSDLISISFEFGKNPQVQLVDKTIGGVLKKFAESSYKYLFLTTADLEFMFFKDHANRFYLICGNGEFINDANKHDFHQQKKIYLAEFVNDSINSKSEKEFLIKLWNKYVFNDPIV